MSVLELGFIVAVVGCIGIIAMAVVACKKQNG